MKSIVFSLMALVIASLGAQSSYADFPSIHLSTENQKECEVTKVDPSMSSLPPEIARYVQGAPPESKQFDFLLGKWKVSATVFNPDGTVLRQYAASWEAKSLNAGRMIMDDYRAQMPNGMDVSSFVTLRTWSPATGRWEIAGLSAHQPAIPMQWHGQWQDDEMRLDAKGQDQQGQIIETRIRFRAITATNFSWESHASRDGGQTWIKTASLFASRVP
jgi:hypothetical protein